MKTIEIVATPDGASTVQTNGFTGSACQQASHFLEKALGSRIDERLTSEFYQAQASEQNNLQRP
jgi:hypothetical protein